MLSSFSRSAIRARSVARIAIKPQPITLAGRFFPFFFLAFPFFFCVHHGATLITSRLLLQSPLHQPLLKPWDPASNSIILALELSSPPLPSDQLILNRIPTSNSPLQLRRSPRLRNRILRSLQPTIRILLHLMW